jgi:hypothetical protein
MNILDRLYELNDRSSDIDSVTIRDAISLIESYHATLLTIANTSSSYPSSMFMQYAKTAITQARLNYNQPKQDEVPEETVVALKAMAFERNRHGSLYDRGSADSYYGRERYPHWYPNGTYNGDCVLGVTEEEIAEYMAGYDWNEEFGDKKSW